MAAAGFAHTNTYELDDDEFHRLHRFVRAVELFHELGPSVPTSYVLAFLAVALKPGAGPTEHARDIGKIQPIMSRILLEIGGRARQRGEGYGLIEARQDPTNLRAKQYHLTHKGRVLVERLSAILISDGV